MIYSEELVHISTIKAGDTVIHNGVLKTVCKNNLKHDVFMGKTLFGDSYHLGHKKVIKAVIYKAIPVRCNHD